MGSPRRRTAETKRGWPASVSTESLACVRTRAGGCQRQFDERGNKIGAAFFGVDGKPCRCMYGWAACHGESDERGNRTRMALFGVNGKPCLHQEGWAVCQQQFDERRETETAAAFFGVYGEPVLCGLRGYHRMVATYDARGKCVAERYFDCRDKPISFAERMAAINKYLATNRPRQGASSSCESRCPASFPAARPRPRGYVRAT